MRQLFLGLVVVAIASGSALAGERDAFTVDKFAQTVTHACDSGERVVVNGASNTVTLTGACGDVVVNGSQNKVTAASIDALKVNGSMNAVDVDAVARIAVSGTKNVVTWKKALAADVKAPTVKKSGVGNSVERAAE